ncbi:MAG TPA: sodium:solute symporter family protein [Pseudomonadales bacterium]|nr:sodium:solute symporter family protein [Gammaproteobacteria bacterium]HIL82322.1 sodium:solute symporter family protein [Pseudomonadales bacterium]
MFSLQEWSWFFLIMYIAAMLYFGMKGLRSVKGADDFATARGGYNGFFLALAFTATTASGATFLGLPGLGYEFGFPVLIYAFSYPLGVYFGVMLCFRVVSKAGNGFNSRSIPEFLGDRYQSDGLRIGFAVFSIILLFYLAGQLVAGLVMFQQLLGLSPVWALTITSFVLLIYVTLGGAHADILTDAFQGGLMLILSVLIIVMFVSGMGVGGFDGLIARFESSDPALLNITHESVSLFDSKWDFFTIFVAHIPLGMLPHIGNKIWALKEGTSQSKFLTVCTIFGVMLAMMSLGGLLARAVLGDVLLADGGANQAIPALFISLFPVWLAALLGVGILAAIMSTADGLVISTSQVVANDIYRRSLSQRMQPGASEEEIDRRVLQISRWSTGIVLIGAAILAWNFLDMNIALLVWIGLGGVMSATAGPMILGMLWQGATKAGAISGFVAGALSFMILKAGLLPDLDSSAGFLAIAVSWLDQQQPNPFACSALGEGVSVVTTFLVSIFTNKLPQSHVNKVFGEGELSLDR